MVREILSATPALADWVAHSEEFGQALRTVPHGRGDLLLIGTPDAEPWHLAAHLDDEARLAELPQLEPTLIRYEPPPGAPRHLSIGLDRIEAARRGEAVFIVAEEDPPDKLLERLGDARKRGATLLTLADGEHSELSGIAHDMLVLPRPAAKLLTFDTAQHLVSVTAGDVRGPAQTSRTSLRARLGKLLDDMSGPRIDRW